MIQERTTQISFPGSIGDIAWVFVTGKLQDKQLGKYMVNCDLNPQDILAQQGPRISIRL